MPRGVGLGPDEGRWNHNVHYHRLVPAAVPPPYGRVLDVGCGEGLLSRRLAPFATHVTGVDVSPAMIDEARRQAPADLALDYRVADVLVDPPAGVFDLVTSVAVLHHLALEPGLVALRERVAPGGTLVVVGLAAVRSPADHVAGAVGLGAAALLDRRHGVWEPDQPLADPTTTLAEVRSAAARLVPGARVRRHLLWRYSLVWHAPRA